MSYSRDNLGVQAPSFTMLSPAAASVVAVLDVIMGFAGALAILLTTFES